MYIYIYRYIYKFVYTHRVQKISLVESLHHLCLLVILIIHVIIRLVIFKQSLSLHISLKYLQR